MNKLLYIFFVLGLTLIAKAQQNPQGNLILKDSTNSITVAEIATLKTEIADLKKNS